MKELLDTLKDILFFTSDHIFLKNSEVNPSGPSDFPDWKEKRVSLDLFLKGFLGEPFIHHGCDQFGECHREGGH